MHTVKPRLMLGAALCALFLSGCSSGGLSLGASTAAGLAAGGAGTTAPPPDSGSGSGTSTGGTGGGTSTGGSGTGSGALGDGAVTVTAGGTTATSPAVLDGGLAGHVSKKTGGVATSLVSTGNALLPTGTTSTLQSATSGLPVGANVAGTSLGGAPTQPVGVSVLSPTQTPGSVVQAGVLSNGQTGTVTVNPSGTATTAGAGSTGTGAATPGEGALSGSPSPAQVKGGE